MAVTDKPLGPRKLIRPVCRGSARASSIYQTSSRHLVFRECSNTGLDSQPACEVAPHAENWTPRQLADQDLGEEIPGHCDPLWGRRPTVGGCGVLPSCHQV